MHLIKHSVKERRKKLSSATFDWYFEVSEACLCGPICVAFCYFAFVVPILEYCSPVWGSAAECHL